MNLKILCLICRYIYYQKIAEYETTLSKCFNRMLVNLCFKAVLLNENSRESKVKQLEKRII